MLGRLGRFGEDDVSGDGLVERRDSSLVGREYELGQLQFAVEGARKRRTQLVEIVGDAGIGKSRLVEELPRLASGFFQHSVTCERYRSSEAYFPLRSLLRSVAGIPDAADATKAGVLLRTWVESVAPELLTMLRLMEAPFAADTRAKGDPGASDPSRRRNLMHVAVDSLLSRTLMMPSLLVFEDTQWMDEASRALLDHLVQSTTTKPWLVCVTRRPEGEPIGAHASSTVIALRPLEPASAMALARTAAEPGIHPADLERIVARSGGNPFFIRELVAAGHGADRALPASVGAVLRERLDSLEREDRVILGYAAAIGRRFDLALLRPLLASVEERVDLDHRIGNLSSFLVEVESDRFLFRHDLVQEAAYAQLEAGERRRLHGLIAAAIERRAGSAVEEVAAELVLHFRDAGDWQQMWRYAVLAGRNAEARYANVVAAELFELALEVAASVDEIAPDEVAEVREALGDVHMLAGRFERADGELQRAEPLVHASPVAGARILRKRGRCAERVGRYDDASALLDEGRALIPDPPAPGDEARECGQIEAVRANVAFWQGRFDIAIRCCDRAIESLGRDQGDLETLAYAYQIRETSQDNLRGTRSDEYRLKALAIYEELGDIVGLAQVANNLGVYEYFAGRWDEALRFYRRATETYRRMADINALAGTLFNEGEILSDKGQFELAGAAFDEAHSLYEATGSKLGAAVTTGGLGRLAARTGLAAEAEQLLRQALSVLEDISSENLATETKAQLAEALVLGGDHRPAYELATRTLAALGERRSPGVTALLERVAGYAALQHFEPDVAADHFRSSLASADEDGVVYERALTLRAMAELAERTGLDEPEPLHAEAQEILDRLRVVALPAVPLPETFFEPHEHRL
jgi:tetratricopeptide (TPR) repeat protein